VIHGRRMRRRNACDFLDARAQICSANSRQIARRRQQAARRMARGFNILIDFLIDFDKRRGSRFHQQARTSFFVGA
jgi:hypothetical protein